MERKLINSIRRTALAFGKAAFIVLVINFSQPVFAQTSASFRNLKHVEPTKLEDYDLPKPVLYKIKAMKPEEITQLNEEVQQTVRSRDGEKIIKLRLKFNDDYVVGFFEEAAVDPSKASNEFAIVVPVDFACTTTKEHAKQHTGRLSELKELEEKHKCTGWHQSGLEQAADAQAPKQMRKQKKKNNGDGGLSGFDRAAMKVVGLATFVFVAAAAK